MRQRGPGERRTRLYLDGPRDIRLIRLHQWVGVDQDRDGGRVSAGAATGRAA
jgi:hypothetical protein